MTVKTRMGRGYAAELPLLHVKTRMEHGYVGELAPIHVETLLLGWDYAIRLIKTLMKISSILLL